MQPARFRIFHGAPRSYRAGLLFTLVSLALLATWVGAAERQGASAPETNLITIVTDDQGRWAVGAYGNDEVRTPHIDRLAREGALFTRAFVASPVCSPARATWLTGRYPTELGITDWISPDEAREGVGLRARTWVQELQDAGYATGLFGKWHLGEADECHPTRLGFDTFVGFLAGGNRPMNPRLEVDGELRKLEGPLPDLLTDHAIAFVERNRGRAFHVALHFRAPHLPYGPVPEADSKPFADLEPTIPEFRGLDRAKVENATRKYYASIHSIDRNIGRLLDKLDEWKLSDRTLVLFTSDHGYNEGRHGINTKGNGHWIVGGRSGPKRPNMWDTSIAVPLVVRWPGKAAAGERVDGLISNIDMYRTLCGALGIALDAASQETVHGIDGCSLLFSSEEAKPIDRSALFGQYDLHNNGLAYMRMIRTERYKLVRHFHTRGMDELYDLESDPEETKNLYRRMRRESPEQLAELERRLEDWMRSIGDPLLEDDY